MKKEIMSKYSEWLFNILNYAEQQIDTSKLPLNEQRMCGFLGELLMDVWIETNKINYIEVPVLYLEKQNYLKRYIHSIKGKLGLLK